MDCPVCRAPTLEEVPSSASVLVDSCRLCRGVWLDGGELQHFAANPLTLPALIERAFASPVPSTRKCPRCGKAMQQGRLDGALLDQCVRCSGLWTDAADLVRLEGFLAKSPAPDAGLVRKPTSLPPHPHPLPASRGEGVRFLAPLAALPNLAFRSTVVLASMYAALAAVFWAASAAGLADTGLLVQLAAAIVLVQFLLSPILMDFSLAWFHSMSWAGVHELPVPARDYLLELCERRGIPAPKLGIIEDGNPNAFTYGHTPNNARLVVTRGLLHILDEQEVKAVIGHEMGHVVHWDMLVMTAAVLVPMILYTIYDKCWELAKRTRSRRTSGRKKGGDPGAPLAAIAIVAYVLYIATKYLLLFLSRLRELHADRFAGETTGAPNALASALVKIAYGLASAPPAVQQQFGKKDPAYATMGIFDATAARALAATSLGVSAQVDRSTIAGAMQWDLWNPWAKYFELHSSHPLPAKRIEHLADQAEAYGQEPYLRFDLRQPESYWDEFFVDLLVLWLPGLLAGVMLLWGWKAGTPPHVAGGAALIGFAAGYALRLLFAYSGSGFPETTVAGLLKNVKVSHVRGVPAKIRGKVIGRGVPGYFLSEDLVLRDETGFVLLDYTQPMRLMEWWFALARRGSYEGKEVTAEGWYRRAPVPYLELRRLAAEGEASRSWTLEARWLFAASVFAAGLLLGLGTFG